MRSDDMPWLRRIFALRFPHYDAVTTETWMREVVLKSPVKFDAVRTDGALCISMLCEYPWLPAAREVLVLVVLADRGKIWQTLPLLRWSLVWARRRGAVAWRYEPDTGHDMGPLMRRLGIAQDKPRYRVEFSQ